MRTDPFFLNSLTVENIRCFGEAPQLLSLTDDEGAPAKWTIILGDNGVGKTSLLQLISLPYYLIADNCEFNSFEPKFTDKSVLSNFHSWNRSDQLGKTCLEIFGVKEKRIHRITSEMSKKSLKVKNIDNARGFTPICGYGANRSIDYRVGNENEFEILSLLDPHADSLVNARNWLRELDYASSKRSEYQTFLKKQFGKVVDLIINILPDVRDIRISAPRKNSFSPEVEFYTPYGWVELKDVAYGYQSFISWIVDFAYRLFTHYPDSNNPLSEPAICLIDELDLHLHPSWQRDVMGYLSSKFPNTQFIATVHSPLVVQAAPSVNANVAVLRRVKGEPFDHVVIDNDPEIIRSWRLDQLLASDLFSTVRGPIEPRNPAIQKKIDERREILSKPKLTTKDKVRLGQITDEIDVVPVTETSEYRKAQELLSDSYKMMISKERNAE